jgi:hypothetical protein
VWETAGSAASITLPTTLPATRTDLLERNLEALPAEAGSITVPVRPLGLVGVRLGEE